MEAFDELHSHFHSHSQQLVEKDSPLLQSAAAVAAMDMESELSMLQTMPLHDYYSSIPTPLRGLSSSGALPSTGQAATDNVIIDGTVVTSNSSSTTNLLVEIVSHFLLFLLIFGMSGTVNTRSLKRQMGNRYAIGVGLGMQFIVMPFLGFCAVMALKSQGLTTPMGITLLMVTASPGGSFSNFWCSIFNADLALSVAMTALSTVFSILFLPANLLLYSYLSYGSGKILSSIDFSALFISISIVITAICLGFFMSHYLQSKTFQKCANTLGSMSGLGLIIFSAVFSSTGTSSTNEHGEDVNKNPWDKPWSFYVGVIAPCLGGLLLANIIAKSASLQKPEVVTLSVECCYQNVGIATSAALSMFNTKQKVAEAMAVALFYGLVEAIVLGIYCFIAWKAGWTKAPKDEYICLAFTKSYEIEAEEILEREMERRASMGSNQQDLESKNAVDDEERHDTFETNTPVGNQSTSPCQTLDPLDRSAHTGRHTRTSSDADISFATSIRSFFTGNIDFTHQSFRLPWSQDEDDSAVPGNVHAGPMKPSPSSVSQNESLDNTKSKKSHETRTTVISFESVDESDTAPPGRVRSETDDTKGDASA